jgi:hypothetical protein
MNSLLLLLSLSCSPGEFHDETVKSANGRFALAVTARGIALSEKGAAKWQRDAVPRSTRYLVSDSGAWVAAVRFDDCIDCDQLELFGPDGKTVAQLKLLNLLSEEERQFIGYTSCGPNWLSKHTVVAETLELEILQGGNVPPMYDQGPTVRFTIDGKTGAFTRGLPVPRASIDELLAADRRAPDPDRRQTFSELVRKAQLTSSKGNRPLCDYFLERAQNGEDVAVRAAAVGALGLIGVDADLARVKLLRLRGDEGDLEILSTLEARDPSAARALALRVLREKREPELLRQRAIVLLIKDGTPELWDAAALGIADSSPTVREGTVYALGGLPRSLRAFELLLVAAVSADAGAASRARIGIAQNYLENPVDPQWKTRLAEAVAAKKLERWGGALIIAAAVAEQQPDAAKARALYQRGAKLLDLERPKQGYWCDLQSWCEAKLRLGQLAANAKEPAEAVRLGQEILTAKATPGGDCGSAANSGAQKLVDTKGAPLPPPRKAPDTGAMIRQMEQMQRAAQERAKAR